jgi:hypothetical protein
VILEPPAFRHEWGAAELAHDDSGDSIDVCLLCGELRYISGEKES